MRRRLPEGVKMYTGDDFNYPELIAGDEQGYSRCAARHFRPLAPAAALALSRCARRPSGFRRARPDRALARLIFRAPTQYYKTGVVFLAWLNGFQDHFVMSPAPRRCGRCLFRRDLPPCRRPACCAIRSWRSGA